MLCTYYLQDMQDHSVSSDSSKYLASTLQHSLWYHSRHLLHSIISPSSSPRQWHYTFIVTSLHDLHFLVTNCQCSALNPFALSFGQTLIFLNESSPFDWQCLGHLLLQMHHNLLCQPALGCWHICGLKKSDISVCTSLKCKKSYYKSWKYTLHCQNQ